jgi:hypothetical protein
VTETTVATAALRSRGLTPDVVVSTVVAVAMMSRRSPKALPPGDAACCSGKLNDEESKQYESEQEDVSVSIGIMSFYKKKQKKRGRGRPRKVPPPPLQPARIQKVDEPKADHWNKYHNYSDPAVAAARLGSGILYLHRWQIPNSAHYQYPQKSN